MKFWENIAFFQKFCCQFQNLRLGVCLAKCLKFPKFEAGCAYKLVAYKKTCIKEWLKTHPPSLSVWEVLGKSIEDWSKKLMFDLDVSASSEFWNGGREACWQSTGERLISYPIYTQIYKNKLTMVESGVLIYKTVSDCLVTREQPGEMGFLGRTAFTGSKFVFRFFRAKNCFL